MPAFTKVRSRQFIASAAVLLMMSLIAPLVANGPAAAAKAPKLSGSPINIMTATPIATAAIDESQQAAAGNAAVKMINASGGINGHRLDLHVCNTEFTNNGEVACAREAAASKDVALVSGLLEYPSIYSALQSEGMPYIGGEGITAYELSSPISFPLGGGDIAWYYGAAAFAVQHGSKHPGFLECASNSCVSSGTYFKNALKSIGMTNEKIVSYPLSTTEFSAPASELVSAGVDSVSIVGYPISIVQQVEALRQAGFTGPIYATDGQLGPQELKTLGPSNLKNVYAVSVQLPSTDLKNTQIRQFRTSTLAQDPSANLDSTALTEWIGVQLFAGVAKRIKGQITAASVLKVMKSLTIPVNLHGLTPPYSYANKKSPFPKTAPQIRNFTVMASSLTGGVVRPVSSFVNPINLLKSLHK